MLGWIRPMHRVFSPQCNVRHFNKIITLSDSCYFRMHPVCVVGRNSSEVWSQIFQQVTFIHRATATAVTQVHRVFCVGFTALKSIKRVRNYSMTSCLKYCTSVTIEASWNPVKPISRQVRSQTEIQCVFQVIVTDFKMEENKKERPGLHSEHQKHQVKLGYCFCFWIKSAPCRE